MPLGLAPRAAHADVSLKPAAQVRGAGFVKIRTHALMMAGTPVSSPPPTLEP